MKITSPEDIPSSVYRIQLNADFTLKKAIKILPYLKDLGVEGVYCSPFYDAYTSHGYDVTNPNSLNPKIGTLEEYGEFCAQLKKLGLKQIIDVVPNHMGIKGGKNLWWQDVLENGPHSSYASFFDINWNSEKHELQDRILLPILGCQYGTALENQEIKLFYKEGEFFFQYADYPLPIAPSSYAMILEKMEEEFQELAEFYRTYKIENKHEGQQRLHSFIEGSLKRQQKLSSVIKLFNGKKRIPESFDLLDRLLEAQFYRLSYWRVASHEINYRRFFNIHELVSLSIEEEKALKAHHRWVFELLERGDAQGLRIDHPDGLYDPISYFERIRSRFPVYTVVEKILDRKEHLPESWQVEGTVGYAYLNLLNGLFICQSHEKEFTEIYDEFIGKSLDFEEILYESKKLFASYEMVSEVEALGLKLDRLSEHSRYYRDFTRHDLTNALAEVIACFPVYRTYIEPKGRVSKRDSRYISIAIKKAKSRVKDLDTSIFDFLEKLLLLKLKTQEEGYREFVLRFQQLTAPIMAKGLEDTTFYIYNRFISLNEVGGDPPHFGNSINDFHRFNQEKLKKWPFGFLATSTHDTKRSEDIRMRLNVLSEIPNRWRLEVKKWSMVNSRFKKDGPTSNTEYFIYQTLLGVWPKRMGKREAFFERIWEIVLKSMREAKRETSWMSPNLEYEEQVREFLHHILSHDLFLKHFIPFQREIDALGAYNSLAMTALKIASCGVVDIYQGNEMLHFRLVDPDNRSTVDFELRKKMLSTIKKESSPPLDDFSKAKLYFCHKALKFRFENKELFLIGEYIPLRVRGQQKDRVIAFMRKYEKQRLIVVVGRFLSKTFVWGDTEVLLPNDESLYSWVELFSGRNVNTKRHRSSMALQVSELFDQIPVSYLYV